MQLTEELVGYSKGWGGNGGTGKIAGTDAKYTGTMCYKKSVVPGTYAGPQPVGPPLHRLATEVPPRILLEGSRACTPDILGAPPVGEPSRPKHPSIEPRAIYPDPLGFCSISNLKQILDLGLPPNL